MASSSYVPPEGFITLAEAERRLGVAKATAQRMTRDGRLPTYEDPRDRRVSLVKIEDVERLRQPIPKGKAAA